MTFLSHLINGISLGSVYAIIALGYTMVYGILKFINFAHGDILMVGAFIGLLVYTALTGDASPSAWTLTAFFISMFPMVRERMLSKSSFKAWKVSLFRLKTISLSYISYTSALLNDNV